jgi:hypothetical protein
MILKRAKQEYGVKEGKIEYPFVTFNDHTYSFFMTRVLESLQIRFFEKGLVIAKELDECNEILFVY